MASVPQDATLDVKVAIRELNDEIRDLRKQLEAAKKQIPSTKAVEELQGAVTRLSKTPTYLDPNDVFRKSGPPHMHGYVPDPGPTPGTAKFLREDATWQAVSGGTPGPHSHASDEITHVGSGYIAANDVKEAIEELDSEKLARSGAQPMLGDLDMGLNDIQDVLNLFFTGGAGQAMIDAVRTIYMTGQGEITGVKLIDMSASGVGEGLIDEVRRIDMNGIGRIDDVREGVYFDSNVGEGVIDNPRVIHMTGDDADNEARIDGLDRVVFNLEVAQAVIQDPSVVQFNPSVDQGANQPIQEGSVGWDSIEKTLVGTVLTKEYYNTVPEIPAWEYDYWRLPLGWVAFRCLSPPNPG
jgi:prefoldin subunit 5